MKFALIFAIILSATVGCEPANPPPGKTISANFENIETSATFAMPAKQLKEQVKRVIAAPPISIPIDREYQGTILTGYKEYQGDLHILRHWQDRTRFRIMITPAWEDPANASNIQITEHTQQRASDKESWKSDSDLNRRERCDELLQQIQSQLKNVAPAQAH
jgi:hypothetical protein